jgi:hypothetical protein
MIVTQSGSIAKQAPTGPCNPPEVPQDVDISHSIEVPTASGAIAIVLRQR